MIDALVSSPQIDLLEQTLNFTERRHQVLMANIANASTPGYVQKDLSVEQFQNSLRQALDRQRSQGAATPLDDDTSEIIAVETPNSVPFHDRGIRSMEYLMSQLADNALSHNMTAQFLRGRYDTLSRAISLKV